MNWSRAKTILIIFLLATCLLLSGMLYNSARKSSQIQPDTIQYATTILKERGITVNPSVIPTNIKAVKIYTADNCISDYADFAKLVFSDCVETNGGEYTSELGTLSFNGDRFTIKYTNGIQTDPKLKSPAEKAKAYLLPLGIDVSDASVNVSNDAQGLFTVSFQNKLDSSQFFDSRIDIELLGEKIVSVDGVWFQKNDTPPTSVMLDSAPGLLVKFASVTPEFSNIEITSLTFGYAINEKGVYHKETTVLPVYQLVTADNQIFYIDARGK